LYTDKKKKKLTLTDMPRLLLLRDSESEEVWQPDFLPLRLRTSTIYALNDRGREYSLILPSSLLLIVMISSSSTSSKKEEDGKMGVIGLFDEAVEVGEGGSLGGGGNIRAR
jgi:hypothetical protein